MGDRKIQKGQNNSGIYNIVAIYKTSLIQKLNTYICFVTADVHVNSKSGLCMLKTSAARQKFVEVEIIIFTHKKGILEVPTWNISYASFSFPQPAILLVSIDSYSKLSMIP